MWKSIADGYEVETSGQVRSLKSGTPQILKPRFSNSGYLYVGLWIDGVQKNRFIHKLVAQAFLPNPLNLPEVNHINGVKSDNRVENLEWCTRSENNCHAYATGLKRGSDAKLTNEQVVYIRDNPNGLTAKELADKFGVREQTISLTQLGKTYKSAGGTIRQAKPYTYTPRLPDDVRNEIRQLYVRGSKDFGTYALAKRFGVSTTTIRNIIKEASD